MDEEEAARWFPWTDRVVRAPQDPCRALDKADLDVFQSATLDIVQNFPRTSFSDMELQVMTWLLAVNGVNHVPSISQMKSQQEELRKHFAVQTKKYDGALGHTYYVNSLAGIIAQVCSASFFPSDFADGVTCL